MAAFIGAQVIVVDDDPREALPIIKAFARKGVASAYFDGSTGMLPSTNSRLRGVRLAILDLVLAEGAQGDVGKVSPTIAALSAILSPENGPYSVILWTKHEDLKAAFEDRLFAQASLPRPVFTVMIEKADCKNKNGAFSLPKLSTALDDALTGSSALYALQAWETYSFLSSSEVVNSLSALVSPVGGNLSAWRNSWETGIIRLIRALAAAAAGKNLDRETFLGALFSSLNPLHADRMETHITEAVAPFKDKVDAVLSNIGAIANPAKATVHTMLHLSTKDLGQLFAGNMYRTGTSRGPRGAPTASAILDDMLKPSAPNVKAQVESGSVPVIVECTAACDHAQQKIRVARFVGGVLIPDHLVERIHPIQHLGFAWGLGPIQMEMGVPQGIYHLRISARHWMTVDLASARRLHPIGRLRAQAFTDLQSFLSRHAGRAGVMSLS